MDRAYSLLLDVKALDEVRRFSGLASTPDLDRLGHAVDMAGVKFTNPLPLLLHHDPKKPVGSATLRATPDGIAFEAELPTIAEPGPVKDEVDRAWQSVKAGLIKGVSIGYQIIDGAVEMMKSGGFKLLKIEVFELSLVTVPANARTTIRLIKELDLAASGPHLPGVTGLPVVHAVKAAKPMTTQEQIVQFENTRASHAGVMTNLLAKSAETCESLDEAQATEYEDAKAKVASCDAHLVRLRDVEKLNLGAATRVTTTAVPGVAQVTTSTMPVIQVKSQLPPGTSFVRACMSMARGKGDSYQTLQYAKQWKDTPEVEQIIEYMWNTKAAVAAGTTTDATWAGPLVVTQPLNEFLELLRPRTILGSVPGFRNVPFNISIPSQTAGGTYGWVGQGLAKPVTKPAYATVTLPFAKAAGIIVLTEELVKLSSPSAEALVREEMIAGMAQFLDVQFNDPAVAVAANVSPASITNGQATAAASGVTSAAAKLDLAGRVAVFTAAGIPLSGSVWGMSDSNAFGLSQSVNALGQPLFPGMNGISGGNIFGMPVVVSNSFSTRVVLMHAPSILFADEGGTRIDVSREASVQMDSAPTNPADATTVLVSLWQNNLVGLRVERMITWKVARTGAVTYLTAAAYIGT